MLIFFVVVSFLIFQIGHCLLCFYLMDARRHRKFIEEGFSSIF